MSLFFDRRGRLLFESTLPLVATFLFIGFLIWIAVKLRSWYRDDSGLAADRDELLLHFKDLERRGQISSDEYRSIRGRLVDQNADSSTAGKVAAEEHGCDAANAEDESQNAAEAQSDSAGALS